MSPEFNQIFARLRAILQKNAGSLTVRVDSPTHFCLSGGVHPTHKAPFDIAWAKIDKAYVSYHFMPIYAAPTLLDGFSQELRSRMQGKSCFNFKKPDEKLFEELDRLTVKGFTAFKNSPFMTPQPRKST